jgi:threonylcarbamoyladenosine tRNA methylthiotransferase MtaB
MPQVEGPTIKARAARLRAEGERAVERHLRAQMGRAHDILMETGTRGRTPHFTPVELAEGARTGDIVAARVTGHRAGALEGTLLPRLGDPAAPERSRSGFAEARASGGAWE